jgi:ATP-dependent Clp endopeptidase proteolytic subunit ClpP
MKTCFTFKASADESAPAEILIYDQIGRDFWSGDGVVAKEFAQELAKIPAARKITVGINSPGGSVHDGLAIYNLLSARRNQVTCRVDGLAASIASIIALAGSKLVMPASALLMIHDPSGMCMGTADEMREMAAALEKHKEALVNVYETKTKKPRAEIEQAMKDETWFTATDAKAFGLVDEITAEVAATNSFDLSQFRRVPASLKNQTKPPAPNESGATNRIMNRTEMIALATALGIKIDNAATDEQLKAALLAHKPATPTATAVVTVNAAADERLKLIEAQLETERRARVTSDVQACADAGRIPGASVKDWVADIMAAPTAEAGANILARLQAMPERKPGHDPVGGGGKEAPKAMKRSDFMNLSQTKRNEFIRDGGKLTD